MAKRERRRESSWGVAKFAPRRRSASRPCWKALAVLLRRLKSPVLTAGGSGHQVFLWDSSHEIPGTSSGLPVSSRPTFRWASHCKSRLWPALAGFQKCDLELALSGRVPCAWTSWKFSCRVSSCAPRVRWISLPSSSAPSPNRKTHPAPLQEAATKPGVLYSEA